MAIKQTRRDFLKLAGSAGIVFSTGLYRSSDVFAGNPADEFYFVQFTDTHYGFDKAKINPDPVGGLNRAIDKVNQLKHKPDFVIFTGDLTHTTDNEDERRKRMREFSKIVSRLEVNTIRYIPGEHDAALDFGEAYSEIFGETYYTFKHKGIQFIAIDNVSDPRGSVGSRQLAWLDKTLADIKKDQPIVIFAHRPLFALYPQWDWTTADGEQVLSRFADYQHVTVFYGHIHQEHHHKTGHIVHHSSKSLIFPLPAPGSAPKRKPLAWDSRHPYRGLGIRDVEAYGAKLELDELEIG